MKANPELQLLQDAAASVLAGHFPVSRLRATFADDVCYDDYVTELRQRAGEQGWFAFLVPGEFGGGSLAGHGIVDAMVIAKQRGRGLAAGPFTDIHVAAAAITSCGTPGQREALLPGLATGDRIVACAFGAVFAGRQCSPLRVTEGPAGIVLNGQVRPVANAAKAGTFLVWATDDGLLRRFLVPAGAGGLRIDPLQGLDLTGRAADVTFAEVVLPPDAELASADPAQAAISEDVALGALLVAADSVGAMNRLLEMTVEYALQRRAFGRVIGGFQAVKHQIADLSMLVQASKAVTDAATEAIAEGHRDAAEIAGIAKAFVGEQSHAVGQGCLQLHGGIGYAWEHDLHLYLRRLAANSVSYGSARYHREAIAERHLGPAVMSGAEAGR